MKNKIIPKNKEDLKKIIQDEMSMNGNNCDLNHIDVSQINDMVGLFLSSHFNGDISKWNTSNVEDMQAIFGFSAFNGDISKWNVSKVKNMYAMFLNSNFNQNISNWDVTNVIDMSHMFYKSQFNQDISQWNISNVIDIHDMFKVSELEKENQLPYWHLPTKEERINAFFNYRTEQEKKHIEDFLDLSSMHEIDKKIKFNKI